MNPCPCGYDGDSQQACRCTPDQILRYRSRISGPLLDRIDLRLRVPRQAPGELQSSPPGEPSATVRERVQRARDIQLQRNQCSNALMDINGVNQYCQLDKAGRSYLTRLEHQLKLSARAQHRLLKTARTIADLENSGNIAIEHLQEAALYRGDL